MSNDEFEPVVRTADLGPGQMAEVELEGRSVLVANVGQTYYAVDAHCPREGASLAHGGKLEHEHVTCPSDGAMYDIRSGACVDPADGPPLKRYEIRIDRNLVLVGPARPEAA